VWSSPRGAIDGRLRHMASNSSSFSHMRRSSTTPSLKGDHVKHSCEFATLRFRDDPRLPSFYPSASPSTLRAALLTFSVATRASLCHNTVMNLYRMGILCATIVLLAVTSFRGTMTPFSVQQQGVMPFHLTAGRDGYLWVVSMGYIVRITTAGKFAGGIATPHAADVADAIVTGRDGNIWFSEEASGVARIGRITPTGELTEYVLPPGSSPIALAAGPDGIAFVGHPTATLGLVTYAGKVSALAFKTNITINSIAYDSRESLWYAGCDGVGRLTRSHVARDYPVEGGCNGDAGVSVARGGLAWFSAGGHIGYVDVSGKMRLFKPLYAPTSMTAAPDGNLWFVNRQANVITRMTPQGTVSRFPTTFGDSPGDIAVGPDGNLWVCGTTKIVRIT
jgi:virginiamycin B lyase